MSKLTEELTFTVRLSFEAHSIAQNCCKFQPNIQKAKQVYLNSLAIYAVDFYLHCLGIETNWKASDSRNPVMLNFLDVADLDIKQIGKIECRPVLPDAEVCQIPPDAWSDRIGYVAVQLHQSLKQATILGFTQTAAEDVPLSQLQSLEYFIAFLSQKLQPESVNLKQWLEGIVEAGWLTIDELLSKEQIALAFGFRHGVSLTRGKRIDLEMQLEKQSVALIVIPSPDSDEQLDIRVQLHPVKGQTYLPPGVKLIVKDASGEAVLDAEAEDEDNLIQQRFSAELGEKFSITIALKEANVTQDFCL